MVVDGYQLAPLLATGDSRGAGIGAKCVGNAKPARGDPALVLSSPEPRRFHRECPERRESPAIAIHTPSAMSAQRLTNHFSACRLISLAKLKAAAEVPGRDANGPYLIAQEGYDPADLTMRPGEYLLGRSGAWLGTHWFVRMPVPERRREFLFATVGEVMELMEDLGGEVKVIRTKPANVTEESAPDPDYRDLLHGNGE